MILAAPSSGRVHDAGATSRVRTEIFDAIRGIGALQVALGHWYGNFLQWNRPTGAGTAVTLFITMSGFLMTVGYADKNERPGFALTFWKRRLARIGPLYWVSLLCFAPLFVLRPYFELDVLAPLLGHWSIVVAYVTTATFVQTWFQYGMHDNAALNVPLWTICAQAFCYALFPAMLPHVHRPRSAVRLACAMLLAWLGYVLLSMAAVAVGYYQVGWLWQTCSSLQPACNYQRFPTGTDGQMSPTMPIFYTYAYMHKAPWNKIGLFALGALCGSRAKLATPAATPKTKAGQLHEQGPSDWGKVAACNALTASVLLMQLYEVAYPALLRALSNGRDLSPSSRLLTFFISPRLMSELLLPPVYALWLYSLTQAPESIICRGMRWWPLRRLGDWSYGIYCLHWPTMEYYCLVAVGERWLSTQQHVRSEALQGRMCEWDTPVVFTIILIVSALGYNFIEVPARSAMQRLLQ